jgi:tetratricopeptide (TPR) repeat protein
VPPDFSGSQPVDPSDLVTFLRGRVVTSDGTPVPKDLVVERVCNTAVRQQVYAAPGGDFSMQLGSVADSFLDASGEPETSSDRLSQNGVTGKLPGGGISRRELQNCELRASVSGFRSSVLSLVDLDTFSSVDVGAIVLQRTAKIQGAMVSASSYKAPAGARRAYEQGLEAEKNRKLAKARQYFEKAVKVYPRYVNAWYMLGTIFQQENQDDAARSAYTQATTIDSKFLPPYVSLASMAFHAGNWTELRDFTNHILDLDPLNYAQVTGDILDLDPVNYADIYFYNSLANYQLNRLAEAEKSGLKAERLDLRTHFPQVHLLMAEIFAHRKKYATAISEIHTYLDLASPGKDVAKVRERLAALEKLNATQPSVPD